jgi:hypothetical protein
MRMAPKILLNLPRKAQSFQISLEETKSSKTQSEKTVMMKLKSKKMKKVIMILIGD